MRRTDDFPSGPDLTAVTTDDAGSFVNHWDDGTNSGPTDSIEAAVARRQRARTIALRSTFFPRR